MTQGLPVSRLVSVTVNLSPIAASYANFNTLLIMGNSNVINVTDRIRLYQTLAAVATDFGTSAPEYLASSLYFGQTPQPQTLYIGRWAQAATQGLLLGGPLTATQQLIATWQAVTNGGFKIAINGGAQTNITGLNFSAAANLNAVATIINTALTAATVAAQVTWNSTYNQFTFATTATGATAAVAALVPPTAGTDISGTAGGFLLGSSTTLSEIVNGIAAESAVASVAILDGVRQQWYGLMFASASIVDSDHLAIAAYIEGDGPTLPHIYGLTTAEAAAITSNDSTSIGYQLKQLGYNRTFYQYSTQNSYAVASIFGRAFPVNFTANNSTITLMYKQEPGVTPEPLTASQASALDSNNYNYFTAFNNSTIIIVNGKVASGQFFDTVWGVDWLANQVQTNIYNLLYTSTTKIPQTDNGMRQIQAAAEAACAAGVNNGLLAPGTWNTAGFGTLNQGDFLPKGYYVYIAPISTQSQANRAARIAPPVQIAVKLAGAVHSVAITVNVNA